MKTAKRILCLALSLVLCTALGVAAFADAIWVPQDDYYEKNYNNCDTVVRHFYTNGENGYVTMCAEPDGEQARTIPNGKRLYVSVSCKSGFLSGQVWGLVEVDLDGNQAYNSGQSGWIDMADMLLVYDYQEFAADHEGEFENPGDMQGLELNTEYVLWSYPGSGIVADSITFEDDASWDFSFEQTWTDADGRLWGFVGYYFGQCNAWICISDPLSKDIPGEEIMTGTLIPAAEPGSKTAEPASGTPATAKALDAIAEPSSAPAGQKSGVSPYVIAAAVAVLVIAVAVLAGTLVKNKKR